MRYSITDTVHFSLTEKNYNVYFEGVSVYLHLKSHFECHIFLTAYLIKTVFS